MTVYEAAYSKFALLCGILAALVILISTYGTQSTIPSLPKPKKLSHKRLAATGKHWESIRIKILHQFGHLYHGNLHRPV